MSNFKFKLNYNGVRDLLHSNEMQSVLKSYGEGIATRAGEGYVVHSMPTRVIAVKAWTDASARDNAKNNTLLKAVRK